MKQNQVIIIKTSHESVIGDYVRLLGDIYPQTATKGKIILKLNLSWTKFYPACSTPPWQLEGVIKGLLDLGFSPRNIIPVENKTVVTDVYQGTKNHAWDKILKKYQIKMHHLTEEPYIRYQPKTEMMVLNKIFSQGIFLPKIIFNKPLISLCTMKTHVFTVTTGAIKNYFGMLREIRHYAHRYIHEAIIDLLAIQKEIHPQIIGIMDGTVVGSGPGPRAMKWQIENYLLGSTDLVALDAVSAKMMGFDPLKIDYLKLAQKRGLGMADPKKIKIAGHSIKGVNLGFKPADTLASRGQKLIYHHTPLFLEKLLLQSRLVPWSYLASWLYHDVLWYNLIGRQRLAKFKKTSWGKLSQKYLSGER